MYVLINSIIIICMYICRSRGGVEMHTVTVYDIQNKFIAYSAPIPEVSQVMSEWGSLYVLCHDGKVRITRLQ